MHHKNEVKNAISVDYGFRLHVCMVVETARLVCQQWHDAVNGATAACRCSRGVRTADCGRRSAVIVGSAYWQRTDFLFIGRDVAITMDSVKILHAVWSAITAIAELLVKLYSRIFRKRKLPYQSRFLCLYTVNTFPRCCPQISPDSQTSLSGALKMEYR